MTEENQRADIEFPDLPADLPGGRWNTQAVMEYVTTAIEHDRKRRGEPVFTLTVIGSLQEWMPTPAAFAIPEGVHNLYLAPQPADPAVKDSFMDRCYQDAEGTIAATGMGQPVGLVADNPKPQRPAPEDEAWAELERRQCKQS